MLEWLNVLAKQVLSQLSYTPTAASRIKSKASGAVREPRNTTVCSIGRDQGMKARSANVRFRDEMESNYFIVRQALQDRQNTPG